MRLASWNVNSVTARLPRLLDWLATAEPDVLCLQETKVAASDFPEDAVAALGYEVAAHGTGRWAGVAVLSRVGLDDVRRGLQDEPGFQPEDAMFEVHEPRAIAATCAGIRIWSVYVPNGREVAHPHYLYKLRWLDALRATAAAETSDGIRGAGQHDAFAVRGDFDGFAVRGHFDGFAVMGDFDGFAVMGDFNIAPRDEDVWDIRRYATSTHVTAPERAALAALEEIGLREVVPRALKYDVPFTYWDYRQLCFPKNRGMRIDLVYADARLASAVTDSWVDREARKGAGPSDHAPIVVDVEPAKLA